MTEDRRREQWREGQRRKRAGQTVRRVAQCGTYGGIKAHRRKGEEVCAVCKAFDAARKKERAARKAAE